MRIAASKIVFKPRKLNKLKKVLIILTIKSFRLDDVARMKWRTYGYSVYFISSVTLRKNYIPATCETSQEQSLDWGRLVISFSYFYREHTSSWKNRGFSVRMCLVDAFEMTFHSSYKLI